MKTDTCDISANPRTVREAWQMQCPKCRADNEIDITAMVDVRLMPDGSDTYESEDGNHYWDDTSPATCGGCGFHGPAREFRC